MVLIERQSSSLLVLGGAVMAALLVVMAAAPAAPAIYGMFVAAPAIGVGAFGARVAAGGPMRRFAQRSAWVAALGGVAIVVVGAAAIATNGLVSGAGEDDPFAIPFALTSTAWMLGSLGVALALVRAHAIPALGARLVLGGTVTALVLGTLLGAIAPSLSPLSAVPFALGWIVVGWHTRRGV